MEPFVAQLSALAVDHPTRAKWVFVPAHAVGRTLGDRLALAGRDWANLRFVTPFDVALRMGAPFLVERGVDPSEEGLGPALVMRLLLSLPAERGYFRPLAIHPRMAAALWATVKELRMAGLGADDLARAAFASPVKRDELAALVRAYESFLAEQRRGDRATVFQEAFLHPDWCPIQPDDCWTELPGVVWSPLERQLLDRMPGERISPRAVALPGRTPPRRLQAARVEHVDPPVDNGLAFLMRPEEAGPAGGGDGAARPPALFHAGGTEAEIEEVFRRVLAAGVPLDQCEVVCASPGDAALVWEKALRYDWPVTMAQGVAAALTRPGRALVAFAEWIEDNFAAGRLRRMLQSGDVRIGDGLPSGRAARLLVQAEAAWGRDAYSRALGRLSASFRRSAARDDLAPDVRAAYESRARHAADLADRIAAILSLVPEPGPDGCVDVQDLAAAASVFVERHAVRASALDHVAAEALVDAIADVRALGAFRCGLDQALRFVVERVESVTVGADRPRPGHLHVSPLAAAGLAGRPRVFVLGLEEGRVFPQAFEDPVLLDAERASLSPALVQSTDRPDEAVYAALVRLAAIGADPSSELVCSYSCRDLREYRQTYASWLLLQIHRVASRCPAATFADLRAHLGPPVSIVPASADRAPDEGRWWVRAAARAGDAARPALLERYRCLDAGVRAREARESSAFTAFDGLVPAAGARLDPAAAGVVVSPTQLEEAASCPFRFFLRRGLGVDAIESGERDRDVWLNPLLRGSLLHDLYARLMRRCREANRRPAVKDDEAWLRECGEQALAELAREMPPASTEVGERETELFLNDLSLFVEAEEALDASRTPLGFEVSFGRADMVDDEPLADPEPVVLDVGGFTIRCAGRIDRIDRVGTGLYEIVDYKTGGYWPDDWQGTFAGGARLQHALYGLAAAALLKKQDRRATVRAAEYYFSSAKGHQERKRIPTPPLEDVCRVLADLREVIASGLFVHAAEERACKWCHHGRACGRHIHDRARAKLADGALAPFNRLATHE